MEASSSPKSNAQSSTATVSDDEVKPFFQVKTLTDKTFKFSIASLEPPIFTVADLRQRLFKEHDIPLSGPKLILSNRVLVDEEIIVVVADESVSSSTHPLISSTYHTKINSEPSFDQDKPFTVYCFWYEPLAVDPIDSAKDWDQKNRLKFFKGLHCLSMRNFVDAAQFLVDSLTTFQETEMMSQQEVVRYAVLSACVAFDRPALKTLLSSSDFIEVADQIGAVCDLLSSFYECRYGEMLQALAKVEAEMIQPKEWLLNIHCSFIIKEMRLRAYGQALRPYRSLSMETLAQAFSVTPLFIER